MKKRTMSKILADTLMDCLVCVSLIAENAVKIDDNGKPFCDEDKHVRAVNYAKNTFCQILAEWTLNDDIQWDIPIDKNENDE